MDDNKRYQIIEKNLHKLGFINVKRWVEYEPVYKITALEVYCSPLTMYEKISLLKKIFPYLYVTGNTNQSYILIKLT